MRPVPTRRAVSLAVLLAVCAALAVTPADAAGPASAYYAADTDGIFWFMHISDLHVGAKDSFGEWSSYDPGNYTFAVNEGVDVIQPVFLVATGDLVNGSANNIPTSGQSQSQWNTYKSIYTGASMVDSFYYDIVGNHDEYSSSCPSLHWYLDNSLQGQAKDAAHFSWTHTTVLGDYFFYGLNMTGDCVAPYSAGDGTLLDGEYNAITAALDANSRSELLFVFAHQGPAQPQNSARLMDHLVQHGVFYVHGHIHEYKEYLAGNTSGEIVVNEVSTTGKGDTDNIGVGVVDHNAFIYRATSHSQPWPFVIVTAPVAAHLRDGELNPWAYDVCKDRVNPFRALIFAQQNVGSVTVKVGALNAVPMTNVQGPLWAAAVDTSALAAGQQTIVVSGQAGGRTDTDSVTAEFYAGPCSTPQQDAGVQDDAAPQQDATPPQQDATPPQQDATPPQQDAAPPQDDAAPPQDDAAPPQQDATPPPQDATPPPHDAVDLRDGNAQQDGSPAQQDGSPAQQDGSVAQQDATPGSDGATGDAATGGIEGGCACRTATVPGSVPGAGILLIVVLGVALRVRRRRS